MSTRLIVIGAVTLAVAVHPVLTPAQDGAPAESTDLAPALPETVRAVVTRRALEAADRYLETWNTRDPAVWVTSLAFPHVRPSAGPFGLTHTPEEYVATVDFARTLASGWHRSQWNSRRVVHVGLDKAHVAGRYTRHRADGSRIWSAAITYVITRRGDRWGTQVRLAAGQVPVLDATGRANATAARVALTAYLDGLSALDGERWAGTLHYPHVRVGPSGDVELWETAEAFVAGTAPGRQRAWYATSLDAVEPLQVGPRGVNLSARLTRRSQDGTPLAVHDVVYLVTERDGVWKVQAVSII